MTTNEARRRPDQQSSPTKHLGDQPTVVNSDGDEGAGHVVVGRYAPGTGDRGPMAGVTVYRDVVTGRARIDVDAIDEDAPRPMLRLARCVAPGTSSSSEVGCEFEYELHGTVRSAIISGHIDDEDDRTVVVRVVTESSDSQPLRVWVDDDLVHDTATVNQSPTDERARGLDGSLRWETD